MSAFTEFPMPVCPPADENPFLQRQYTPSPVPAYDADRLPALIADAHPEWVNMYDHAWQIGFGNLRQPEPERPFEKS